MEDNGSKAEFLRSIQVYLEDFIGVVMHQGRGSAQSFLNTLEGCELLRGRRAKLCLRRVGSSLLATKGRASEECSFERLKGRRELCIKVDVAPQVARQA